MAGQQFERLFKMMGNHPQQRRGDTPDAE